MNLDVFGLILGAVKVLEHLTFLVEELIRFFLTAEQAPFLCEVCRLLFYFFGTVVYVFHGGLMGCGCSPVGQIFARLTQTLL